MNLFCDPCYHDLRVRHNTASKVYKCDTFISLGSLKLALRHSQSSPCDCLPGCSYTLCTSCCAFYCILHPLAADEKLCKVKDHGERHQLDIDACSITGRTSDERESPPPYSPPPPSYELREEFIKEVCALR